MLSTVQLFLSASLCYGYVELESSCLKSYPYPPNQNKSRTLCVQPLLCPKANVSHVRVITEAEVQQQEVPGGAVVLYTAGTSEVSCIDCVRDVCSLINGSLPVITSQEDNECVLGGGAVGTKARIPLAAKNLDNRGWGWPYLPGMIVEGDHEYSNWAGAAVPPGIPSIDLCATMNSAGLWRSTPCDMSAYHTQKDYIVCAVLMHPPPEEKADSSSASSPDSNHEPETAIYIAIPAVAAVLVLAIIVWRKKMDSGDQKASGNNEVAQPSFTFFEPAHTDENIQNGTEKSNTSKSTDDDGYLLPNNGPTYYEAVNEDDGTNEPTYDQIGGPTFEEAHAGDGGLHPGPQYDVALDPNGQVFPNATYVYENENEDSTETILLGSDSEGGEDGEGQGGEGIERTYSVPNTTKNQQPNFNLEDSSTNTITSY
tara:strand:- start:654 stop:1931 length:1278 start_codon:yes stop_codon:yes gene_type:complete